MKIEFEISDEIVEYLRHAFAGYSFEEPIDNNKFIYLLIIDHYIRQQEEGN